MKNSNDIIGNRTRDLPTCSVVSQASYRMPHPGEVMDVITLQPQVTNFPSYADVMSGTKSHLTLGV